MELIGEKDNPAPQLRNVDLELDEAKRIFNKLSDYISLLYNKADLVHADFSEFNVLYDGDPVVIDMGQSVTLEHPMASKFLARDVTNIARYFEKKYGIGSEAEIWSKVKVQ
jgi:RIO kinase 1